MRVARSLITSDSGVYHVFGRGVEKRSIYFSRSEYQRFWSRLFQYAAEEGVHIYCACLKKNHFHLMVYSESLDRLSRMQHRLLTAYAVYFNNRFGRVGHLFQNRYQSKPVETEEYFWQLIEYIRQNAPHANYPWLFVSRDCPRAWTVPERGRG